MEDKDKLKDLKKRIAALGVAGSLMIGGVAGCSSINKDDDLHIGTETSIESTLEDASPYTDMDENLAQSSFHESEKASVSWNELQDKYIEARSTEDVEKCNDSLFKIGYLILKASVSEQTGIDFNRIVNVKCVLDEDTKSEDYLVTVTYTEPYVEKVAGNIDIERERTVEKTFRYKGNSFKFITNLLLAKKGQLSLKPADGKVTVDDTYRVYQGYILSSGVLEDTLWGEYQVVDTELSDEKVAAFKR